MNAVLRNALVAAGMAVTTQATAQIVFYEGEGFQGRSFTTERPVGNFEKFGFNDRASSVVVLHEPWEVCEDARFGGRCMVLRPGRYASLRDVGLDDRISSARLVNATPPVEENRYAPPPPVPVYDNHRRYNERLYDANVTSVHAVVGAPEQRCWVEHQQVPGGRGDPNIPGAIVGGLIGGVLGHQVGNGRGNDVATVGGAVVGAAVGSNVGRDGQQGYTRDVQRCSNEISQSRPEYWDVTYDFRGKEHRIQMTSPPGRTVTVNEHGEPRA